MVPISPIIVVRMLLGLVFAAANEINRQDAAEEGADYTGGDQLFVIWMHIYNSFEVTESID